MEIKKKKKTTKTTQTNKQTNKQTKHYGWEKNQFQLVFAMLLVVHLSDIIYSSSSPVNHEFKGTQIAPMHSEAHHVNIHSGIFLNVI